jgi:hypothetical protein
VRLWQLIRDIVLTALAVFLLVKEAYAARPSDAILTVAFALAAPSIADHAKALLSGPGGGPPSSSPAPPPGQLSGESSGASGEPGGQGGGGGGPAAL